MTGCQLNTRFASPSDHDTPPRTLAHMLTRTIATGERMMDKTIDMDWARRRKEVDDKWFIPSKSSSVAMEALEPAFRSQPVSVLFSGKCCCCTLSTDTPLHWGETSKCRRLMSTPWTSASTWPSEMFMVMVNREWVVGCWLLADRMMAGGGNKWRETWKMAGEEFKHGGRKRAIIMPTLHVAAIWCRDGAWRQKSKCKQWWHTILRL